MVVKTKKTKKSPQMKFYKKLVLNQYFLKLFGVSKFEDIANEMKEPKHEGLDEQNNTNFYHFIINEWKDKLNISKDKLLTYDENIVRHTSKISEKRDQKIRWKYFQYLSLLFTEIYLDKYINETDEFIKELNEYVKEFNQDKQETDQIEYYEKEDLKKLAFWNATGAGKTLTAVDWLLKNVVDKGKKILWIAHRNFLLEQASEAFQTNAYKDIMPNKPRFKFRIISGTHDKLVNMKYDEDVLIASKDSLGRNLNKLNKWVKDEEIYLVIDEAHHAIAKTYREIITHIREKLQISKYWV